MTAATPPTPDPSASRPAEPLRRFGRFVLRRLVGRSDRTMAWRVGDGDPADDTLLVLPRAALPDGAARVEWEAALRRAARLRHPQLAPLLDSGVHEGWPWARYALGDAVALAERAAAAPPSAGEAAGWVVPLLEALAYAHDAGIAHHDLQPFLVLVDRQGRLRLAGTAVAAEAATGGARDASAAAADAPALEVQRADAARDVVRAGLLLHGLLAAAPAFGEADLGRAAARLTPAGTQTLRLPWSLPRPVPEALRTIVDRTVDRRERQRYPSARALLRALDGFCASDEEAGGRPLALLMERIAANGVLPAAPGAAQRAARLALLERGRTDELAQIVLEDVALTLELMRHVHSATVRGGSGGSAGAVLTVRRAIAMLGLEGVRRSALSLREWPGHLHGDQAPAAERLRAQQTRCAEAVRVALALRPPGYDVEIVALVVLWQGLGRLLVHYHFPDEAVQIAQLMQPQPPARPGEAAEGGLDEAAACCAVLGVEAEAMAVALARQWGIDESVLAMLRRLPPGVPPRQPADDDHWLRCVASAAHEAVDALALPPAAVAAALQRVVQRHGRWLDFGARELHIALHGTAPPARGGTIGPTPRPAHVAHTPG